MLYGLISLVIVVASTIILRRKKLHFCVSAGILVAFMLSVISAISLGQNYTQSLIPDSNDGIGISNRIAYLIIGEGGWTIDQFKTYFESSVYISLFIVVLFVVSLAFEARRNK